jgi:hypothetical protein
LNDNNKVKKAIILKEIFDKPRAIRRSIRWDIYTNSV